MDSSKKFPLNIKSSTIHTEFWTLASCHQEIANSGSWLEFSRDGTGDTWQAGMSSDNSYVIRASGTTNLDVGSVAIDAGSYVMCKISVGDTTAYEPFNGNVNGFNLNPQSQMSFVACATNTGSTVNHIGLCCLNRASTYSSYTPAISFSAWGHYYGAELNHIGAIACQQKQIQGQRHLEGDMVCFTKDSTGALGGAFRIYDNKTARFVSNLTVYGLTNSSDDRLKDNEEIVENACETSSKSRPQLYDKKPDMENCDPTTWYKESGSIAQEIYYDSPELRHLVHRGKTDIDGEGNEIPLPEIPTSIDPSQDPDNSSWGKESASVNYIGLIAYLVKANTELHERVKALESK